MAMCSCLGPFQLKKPCSDNPSLLERPLPVMNRTGYYSDPESVPDGSGADWTLC